MMSLESKSYYQVGIALENLNITNTFHANKKVLYDQLLFCENFDVKQNEIYSPECFGSHSDAFIDAR